MAFIRSSAGGGGELSETVIWTNSSPTSNFPVSGNDYKINLDADYRISDFKYLKLVFRVSTNNAAEHSILVDCDDFTTALSGADHVIPMIAFVGTSITYGRRIYYASDTSITIELCRQISGTATVRNYVVPTKIIGLK